MHRLRGQLIKELFIMGWVSAHSIAAPRLQKVKLIFFFHRNALQMVILVQLKISADLSKLPLAYHLQNEERLQVHLCIRNAHDVAFSVHICL